MCSSHLRSGDLCSTFWKRSIFMNYWEFCMADLSILPLFISYVGMYIFVYLFSQWLMSVWTHEYLFYTLVYNPIPLYLFCCSNCFALAIGSSLAGPCVPLAYRHHCECVFFKVLPYCKMLQAHLYISCPSPRINHFSKGPYSFHCRMILQAKVWVLGVLILIGMSLLLGPLSWQNKEYMCV